MFRKVLLAVDGSVNSEQVVEWALQAYEEMPHTEFTFAYVHQPIPVGAVVGSMVPAGIGYVDPGMPQITPAMEAWQRFGLERDRVHQVSEKGNPAEWLCATAQEEEFDLIVLGSQGHGVVSSVLLGSVSAKVLHHAPCPVLVLR